MDDTEPPAAIESARRAWRLAWFAVWSPLVTWVATIALLALSGLFPTWVSACVGIASGLCGVLGVFVAVGGAVESLHSTVGPSAMSGREKSLLACFSVFGILVSLAGYGCLAVFGGFVMLVSPFRDLQLG